LEVRENNMKKYFCIDCKKEISRSSAVYGNNRCRSCSSKGDLNPNFKKGETLKKHYCEVCKTNEISYPTWLTGKKACVICCKIGETNPNYRKGITLKQHYCSDCGNPISLTNVRDGLGRCCSCSHLGNRNYIWRGGVSFLPYSPDFNIKLKEVIRKRDDYTCQNCGMTEEEYLIVYGVNLSIHHIDYNKQNCKEENLITLCNQCNIRANFNRDYWKDLYQNKILSK